MQKLCNFPNRFQLLKFTILDSFSNRIGTRKYNGKIHTNITKRYIYKI